LKIIELILPFCTNDTINKPDKAGCTPINVACAKGYKKIVELLLKNGADINAKDKNGKTPLRIACENKKENKNNEEILRLLLSHKDIDVSIGNDKNETPLHYACLYDKEEIVKLLLPYYTKKTIDKVDIKDRTALHYFAAGGGNKNNKIAELLINKGADVNKVDKYNQTALMFACDKGELEMVQLLLKNGADKTINLISSDDDDTALYLVCTNSKIKPSVKLEIIKLLVENGARITRNLKSTKSVNDYLELATKFYNAKNKIAFIKSLIESKKEKELKDIIRVAFAGIFRNNRNIKQELLYNLYTEMQKDKKLKIDLGVGLSSSNSFSEYCNNIYRLKDFYIDKKRIKEYFRKHKSKNKDFADMQIICTSK
jgi:ankyrin repeat protein